MKELFLECLKSRIKGDVEDELQCALMSLQLMIKRGVFSDSNFKKELIEYFDNRLSDTKYISYAEVITFEDLKKKTLLDVFNSNETLHKYLGYRNALELSGVSVKEISLLLDGAVASGYTISDLMNIRQGKPLDRSRFNIIK